VAKSLLWFFPPFFRDFYAKSVELLEKVSDKSFCTDRFIYTVMDIAGFRFANYEDTKQHTFFNRIDNALAINIK